MKTPYPRHNGYPLSAYEWWIYVNHFWHLMGETGKQLGAKWVKTVSPVTALPAQSGPSVDIKTQSPICLSSAGSRPTIHCTHCICPPSFNDICYFNSTPNSFLFKFRSGWGEEKGTISAFYISIDFLFAQTVAGMLGSDTHTFLLKLSKSISAWPVTPSPCHKDLHVRITAPDIRVSLLLECDSIIRTLLLRICFHGVPLQSGNRCGWKTECVRSCYVEMKCITKMISNESIFALMSIQ